MARALLVLCAALVGVAAQKPDMEDVPEIVRSCVDEDTWSLRGNENRRRDDCTHDPSWAKAGKNDADGDAKDNDFGCDWIATQVTLENPFDPSRGDHKRHQCWRARDDNGVRAAEACSCACSFAAADCAWVAEKPETRCALGNEKMKGRHACGLTCAADPTDDLFDSEAWYYKKTKKGCDWVGDVKNGGSDAAKIEKRCKKKGTQIAAHACPATCAAEC